MPAPYNPEPPSVVHRLVVPFALFACLLGLPDVVFAQQSPCTAEIPLGVVLPDGRVVRQVTPADFKVWLGKQDLAVQSFTGETGPRRILLVLELERTFSSDARRLEAKVASQLFSLARPGDSFALVAVGAAFREVYFDAAPSALAAVLRELESDPQEQGNKLDALDAILRSIDRFGDPRPGDAILAVMQDIDSPRMAAYTKLTKALADRKIRLFAVQVGPALRRIYSTTITGTMIVSGSTVISQTPVSGVYAGQMFAQNQPSLSALASNSGGYFLSYNTEDSWKKFKLTDAELQQRQEGIARVYQAIVEYYRLRVSVPVANKREFLTIRLAKELRAQSVEATFLYPRRFIPCASEPANNR
jgi:hypothetical protein